MGGGLSRVPYQSYNLSMTLPCGPENVDKVIAATWGEIQKIQSSGPDAADLDKVKKNWLVAHRKSLRENNYWLANLSNAILLGTDPQKILSYEKDIAVITAADVQAAAKRYLREDNYVQVVLKPERKAEK